MVAEGVFATGRSSSYCTAAEVLQVLKGCDLSVYGTAEELASRVQELLPGTRSAVERFAGRDFLRHENVSLQLDGNGSDRLQLTESGARPPVAVSAVEVSGEELDETAWCAYEEQATVRLTARAGLRKFPVGAQNVVVTASWGYAEIPESVSLAQAQLTAAQVLGEAGGDAGGVTETRLGDYAVSYGRDGRYSGLIERLCQDARETLRTFRVLRMRAV
jgi:hypothetical protein